jgi:vacuolar-type H+-ATPase subunit I/STV1
MSKQNFNISNTQGDIIGPGASGIVAKTISGTIHVGAQQTEKLPDEFSKSLHEFSEKINELFQKYHIEPSKVEPIQQTINELVEEVAEVKPDEKVDYAKEITIKSKLVSAAAGLAKLLPRGAEVVSAFTPLAPFSKLIGEAVEVVVNNVVKK